ncbi:hypothetical protein ABIC03_006636 [Bradyrhizobium sp. RT6a]|uniref:hypothetical protein n=1 Tax=Bradyrhizobium sp. RT6a TaxID=3156381 RepID=UPI003394D292
MAQANPGLIAAAIFIAVVVALDEHYSHGVYTDRAQAMLREIQHRSGGSLAR